MPYYRIDKNIALKNISYYREKGKYLFNRTHSHGNTAVTALAVTVSEKHTKKHQQQQKMGQFLQINNHVISSSLTGNLALC